MELLRERVAGFRDESDRNQWGLALMAWEGSLKRRQHRKEPGAMSFSAEELQELFGRGEAAALLLKIDFYNRSPGWSRKDSTTREYRFHQQVRQALAAYADAPGVGPVNLLWRSGTRIKVAKALPRTVASTDTKGNAVSAAAWDRAEGMNRVPVKVEALDALRRSLVTCLRDPEVEGGLRRYIERLLDITARLVRMANTTLAGKGHILHVYAMAPAGRLYARGVNLQNAPGLVKEAALDGFWEYDFSNCHFTLLALMAGQLGVACPAIEHYLANKGQVRGEVAEGALISPDQAKQCLLALLYGAKASPRAQDAIPEAIGTEAARRLYAQPAFAYLKDEVQRASGIILANWPRLTANGSLRNACDKAIKRSARPASKLSHLLQGAEAKALMSAVNLYPDDIVLLQHDGFASRCKLDVQALEDAILRETGYRLSVEERRLQLHDEPRELMIRMKSEMAQEAAPGLGFDSVSAD